MMDVKLLATIIAVVKKESGALVKDHKELERKVTAKLQEFHKKSPILETPRFLKENGELICVWNSGLKIPLGRVDGQQGPQGVAGPQGPQGNQGNQGPQGSQGRDGTDGTDGTDGRNGKDGLQGIAGKDGSKGPQGNQGQQGPAGPQGPKGRDGSDGKDGVIGRDGEDGLDGEDGVGIEKAFVNDEHHLIVKLTNGRKIDTGYVRGKPGTASGKGGRVSGGYGGGGGGGAANLIDYVPRPNPQNQDVWMVYNDSTKTWEDVSLHGGGSGSGQNGADGKDGVDGIDGAPGKDGVDGKDGTNGKDGKDALPQYIKQGKWVHSTTPADGTCELDDPSFLALSNTLTISDLDEGGVTHVWNTVTKGCLIELSIDGDNRGLYKVTANPVPTGGFQEIELSLEEGEGAATQDDIINLSVRAGVSTGTGNGVERPNPQGQDKWMVYNDASETWEVATTDLIETNSAILFADAKGVFKDIPVPTLRNQLEVNRWLLEQVEEVYEGHFVHTKGPQEMEGPLTVTGGINANGTRIEDVANPLGLFDAVNKQYADAAMERILTYQTSPTNMTINRYVDAAYYDEANHRILMWRSYFGKTGMTPHPHLIVGDPKTGDVTYLESTNPTNRNRREPISCPFHVGDDIFFVTAENPKDHTFLKLTPDNNFDAFGTLKICRSWCVLNYHVPLNDRFHLFIGNPSDRIDQSGLGSRQAQATLLLDSEDLINQNQIESYEADGITYGTLTKSLSTSRGGTPGVILNGTGIPDVYLFQPDKPIQKINIRNLEAKEVTLDVAGPTLPFGYLTLDGKKMAEIGKINGLTVFENRYIVWHALNVGLMWYDTADESLECIYETDNWIEYGFNRHKRHPNVPNIGNSLYFFPNDTKAHDNNVVPPELLIVNDDKTVESVPIPDPDFKSTNTQRSTALEIVSFDQSANLTAYNVNDRRFERYVSSEALQTGITIIDPQTKESIQKIIPWVAGAGSNPSSFKNCRLLELKESLDEKYIADLNLLANPIIEDHENDIDVLKSQMNKTGEAYIQSMTNEDAIYSLRDGLDDLLNPRMVLATEDPDYLVNKLFEHAYPLFPDESDRFYNLIPQRFVLLARMYEGSNTADDLLFDNFGNDNLDSAMILDVKTGKTRHLDETMVPGYNDRPAYPALRGSHVIANEQGEVDVYFWCHAPTRTVTKTASPWDSDTVPLFHIHIPAEDQIDDSDPFANLTFGYSKIRCHKAEMTYPDKNPYSNYVDENIKYKYEIDSNTFKFKDGVTGKTHYFFCSHNKNARDYVTHRIFEFTPNPNGDMEYGQLHPVDAHPDSTWGSYASGYSCIKEDVDGVEKCYLFGTPVGLTEVYFIDDPDNVGQRKAEMRNYGDYVPLGPREVHPTRTNAIGQPIITAKGIIDNWYKNQISTLQWVNKHPINNDDRMSCTFVFFLGSAGIISINTQDLGIVDRSDEVKLENNYQGDVNSLHINTHPSYMSYLEQGSVKNLPRFNAQHSDMHSLGSVWFFDYKGDYLDDLSAPGNSDNVYNDTKVFDDDGNLEYRYFFKRGIIEVRVDPVEEDIMVIAHSVGRKRSDTNVEQNPTDFSGEGVTKVYDMFVCSSAGKSHSSITRPRVYTFNPLNHNMSLVDNRESAITSLVPLRKEGIIVGSSYGTTVDGTIGTPLYMIEMLAGSSKTTTTRQNAKMLRKLCEVTGESVEDTPDTWTLDEPSTEAREVVPRDPEPDFDIEINDFLEDSAQ